MFQTGFKDRKQHFLLPHLARELRRRGQESADKVTALSTSAVAPVYNENETVETRQHPGYEPEYIGRYLAEHGIWVRTTVGFEPVLGSDPDHPGDPQDPLLVIRTTPLRDQYFPFKRTTNRWQTWHVSLCFRSDNQAYDDHDLGHLVNKFDNKDIHLRFSRISRHITSGELDLQTDPIASNPVVQRVHGAGTYWNRPLHVSF